MKRDASLNQCPVCRTSLPTPATICGPTACPRCEAQLWHLLLTSGPTFFVRHANESVYDLMATLTDSRHAVTAENLEAILRDADSLDWQEFLSQIEGAV
jgi:hypothetical protein